MLFIDFFLLYSYMHLFIHSFIHSLTHSLIHPFIHSFINSFIHSSIRLSTYLFIYIGNKIEWYTCLFISYINCQENIWYVEKTGCLQLLFPRGKRPGSPSPTSFLKPDHETKSLYFDWDKLRLSKAYHVPMVEGDKNPQIACSSLTCMGQPCLLLLTTHSKDSQVIRLFQGFILQDFTLLQTNVDV